MARSFDTRIVLKSSAKLLALAAVGWIGMEVSRQPAIAADQPAAAPTIDFVKDIQPIFQDSCIKCHQLHPTNGRKTPSANFRLDDKAAALKGGRKGHDIVPGDSATSALSNVLKGRFNDIDPMPAADRGKPFVPLSDEKIALIKSWIDQGAVWPETAATQPADGAAAPAAPAAN